MSAAAADTLEEFMAQALAMEREAVQRYGEFADAMEMHNNQEAAALFRTMAQYEGKHAARIMAQMGWTSDPPLPSRLPSLSPLSALAPPLPQGDAWPHFEAPETVPVDDVHYLMQPWHALHLALQAEQRAEAFFGRLAQATTNEAVRRAALELQQEEREHVELVRTWLQKVPVPDGDWANDPDPPRYLD